MLAIEQPVANMSKERARPEFTFFLELWMMKESFHMPLILNDLVRNYLDLFFDK